MHGVSGGRSPRHFVSGLDENPFSASNLKVVPSQVEPKQSFSEIVSENSTATHKRPLQFIIWGVSGLFTDSDDDVRQLTSYIIPANAY